MQQATFDSQLNLLESQLHTLSGCLIDGSPAGLQEASTAFQQLAVEFFQMVTDAKRSHPRAPNAVRRIQALADGMVTFRENLLRRSAYVERALGVLVPAAVEKSTYAGSAVYGNQTRRSGTFTAFSA